MWWHNKKEKFPVLDQVVREVFATQFHCIYLFALSSFLLILDLVIGVLLLGSDELNILSIDLTLGLVFFCFSSSTQPRFLSVLIFINNSYLDSPSEFGKRLWTTLVGIAHKGLRFDSRTGHNVMASF